MFSKINKLAAYGILAAAVAAALPSAALADHRFDTHRDRDDRRESRHDDDRRPSGHVDIRIGGESYERVPSFPPPVVQERIWVTPVSRIINEQVFVPASSTTVVDRVWVEPVVQRGSEHVWIGDRFEDRDVTHWENSYRVTRRQRVLVEAGHYADVARDVVITPGHYEDRPRQQVCEAHYETVTREEVVVPGHWEYAATRVVVARPYREQASFSLRIPFGH